MKKIKSYDKTMAYFLVTPDEMRLLRDSVLLELEYESILKRAQFSEMVFGQYCIRADLRLLDNFLCYAEKTNCEFKDKKKRDDVEQLTGQIRDAFFNPEAEKEESAKNIVSDAMGVLESEEISRDPAYQELLEKIAALIEKLPPSEVDMRFELLKCYFCGASETDNPEGDKALLDYDKFPTGYTEMMMLEEHEEEYSDARSGGSIFVYKFMCPACHMIQTAVFPFGCYDSKAINDKNE